MNTFLLSIVDILDTYSESVHPLPLLMFIQRMVESDRQETSKIKLLWKGQGQQGGGAVGGWADIQLLSVLCETWKWNHFADAKLFLWAVALVLSPVYFRAITLGLNLETARAPPCLEQLPSLDTWRGLLQGHCECQDQAGITRWYYTVSWPVTVLSKVMDDTNSD